MGGERKAGGVETGSRSRARTGPAPGGQLPAPETPPGAERSASRKNVRETVREATKLLAYHRDLLKQEDATVFQGRIESLSRAYRERDKASCAEALARLEEEAARVFPRPPHASIREWVEVLVVAAIVAFGVRTYFLQPFKIPTGSMQPTLYGVYPDEQHLLPATPPLLPLRLLDWAVRGRTYASGGYRTKGDHIFVDRFSYHFRRPTRGEVVVFDAEGIPGVTQAGKFYIKRLVGTGGDTLEIRQPYLYVNGALAAAPPFERIYSLRCPECGTVTEVPPTPWPDHARCPECGMTRYHGYINPSPRYYGGRVQHLTRPGEEFVVPPDSYFVLGDNSLNSSDSRFWGIFGQSRLIGRAVWVYWPWSRRWGPIR